MKGFSMTVSKRILYFFANLLARYSSSDNREK